MNYLTICPVVAFLVSCIATKGTMLVAQRRQLYDRPGPLKIHSKPVPRLGGIGILLGLLLGVVPWIAASGSRMLTALVLLVLLWALGLADDLWNLPSILRLCVQLGIGAGLWIGGWRINFTDIRFLDLVVTALLFAFFVNSMNLLDGMDGLALGVGAVGASGFVLLSTNDTTVTVLAAGLLGACLGSLVFNLPPARTFIGDSGSTLLGAIFCFLTLDSARTDPAGHPVTFGLLLLALPLADATFAVIRRLRSGSSPFEGDRFHYYDLLLGRGWSVRNVLLLSYFTGAGLICLSWLCVRGALGMKETAIVVAVLFVGIGYVLGSFSTRAEDSDVASAPILQEKPTAEV